MPDLVVVIPSRSRPQAVVPLVHAFNETCTSGTELVFAVDDNDPTGGDYWAAITEQATRNRVSVLSTPSRTMVQALNAAAASYSEQSFAVGFMGDDHMPRTRGWDTAYLDALHELGTGIIYGNDLIQRRALPTQCAMTANIIRALGWMAPPSLTHLYVDNFWRDLGQAAGCLHYLPDVIVEHLHPVVGKAAIDEGYARVNADEMYSRDSAAYATYRWSGAFETDVRNVTALMAGQP